MTSNQNAALSDLPTPDHITLLFRCHKSTTLLSVEPTQPLPEIRSLLLAALVSRNLTTFPGSGDPLPVNEPEDLEFGVLADRKDLSKGWVALQVKDQQDGADGSVKSGKKRATGSGAAAGKKAAPSASPLGLGLVDGSWVAYRLRSKRKGGGGEKDDDGDVVIDVDLSEDPGWDVVLPSFEDEEGE